MSLVFGIDFDGTCTTHEFPRIGKSIGAEHVLRKLVDEGHKLVLFTMRSDIVNPKGSDNELHLESGNYLTDAVNWFKQRNIPLYGIQTNPTQHTWTTSPKAYCNQYIDDSGLGCPLKFDRTLSQRPFVDWQKVELILVEEGILSSFG
jgi:hypothetical protein